MTIGPDRTARTATASAVLRAKTTAVQPAPSPQLNTTLVLTFDDPEAATLVGLSPTIEGTLVAPRNAQFRLRKPPKSAVRVIATGNLRGVTTSYSTGDIATLMFAQPITADDAHDIELTVTLVTAA